MVRRPKCNLRVVTGMSGFRPGLVEKPGHWRERACRVATANHRTVVSLHAWTPSAHSPGLLVNACTEARV